jgi:hypothetical protein
MPPSRNNENNNSNSNNAPSPPKPRQKKRIKKPPVPPPLRPAAQKKIHQKSTPSKRSPPPTERSPPKNSPRNKNNIGIITIRGIGSRPVGSHISAVAVLIPRITNNYKYETKQGSDIRQSATPKRKQSSTVRKIHIGNMTRLCRTLGNVSKSIAAEMTRRCYRQLQEMVQPAKRV